MSAPINHHRLRAGIAHALEQLLLNSPHTAIAEKIGVAGTTISRRGDDLQNWPASDLLLLATTNDQLCQALLRYLQGDRPQRGSSFALVGDLHALLAELGQLLIDASEALRDGRVTREEGMRLRGIVRGVVVRLGQVEADLVALIESVP